MPRKEIVEGPRTKTDILTDLGSRASEIKMDHRVPKAYNVSLVEVDNLQSKYVWADQTAEAKKARKEFKVVLNTAWQSSALNFDEIAEWAQCDVLAVRGLIDEDFRIEEI